jgi:hypothetical protein
MYKQRPFELSDTTLRKTLNSVQEEVNASEVSVAVVVRGRAVGVGKQGTA